MCDPEQLVFEVECACFDSSDSGGEHILRVMASSTEELLSATGIMAASYRRIECDVSAETIDYWLPKDRDSLQSKMIKFMTGMY